MEEIIMELSKKYNTAQILIKLMLNETLKNDFSLEEAKELIKKFFEK